MATAEEILATFKDFIEAPDGQDLYVAQADADLATAETFNTDDTDRNWAVAYLAAHRMVLGGLGSATAQAGVVTSKRIGSLSISYASGGSVVTATLSTTPYGRLLQEWFASHVFAPMTSYAP